LIDLKIAKPQLPPGPEECWLYYPIRETKLYTFAVFGLRKGQKLPLHDHPKMTVLMKPLFGKIHVRSFDDRKFLGDQEIENPEILEIGKDTGDIHEISAVHSDCAFADIVFPPYDLTGPRAISYFEEVGDGQTLRKISLPKESRSILVNEWK
jgi:hypothetical protein